ncbi:MAG: hypothetical protein OEX82_06950, partial [Nitrosomonas sp.]|nr:hypothetical protein [Nitrosomonas sp.]
TLQRVFFQTIVEHITAVHDDFDDKTTAELVLDWDEAITAFEAITGTAARENKVITADRLEIEAGNNPGLDTQIANAFSRGRAALAKDNPVEDKITVAIERQNIHLSLVRAYYIGVLREVDGIISNRNREPDVAREKQKEGEIFYRLIRDLVEGSNPTGNFLIQSQLTGELSNVVADEVVSELNKGFIGLVRNELSANETSVVDDRGRAKEVAEAVQLYTNVFLPDLEIRLGATASNDLSNALTSLKNASNDSDAVTATTAREAIENILVSYENELVLANYDKANATDFVDSAVLSFQEVSVLRKQNPVDVDALAAAYAGELQQLTQFADEIYGLTMGNDLSQALDDIKNDNQPKLAVQVIDKTLQRVFALAAYNRITFVQEAFDNLTTDELTFEWDRAYAAYLSIAGTAARENKVLTEDRQSIQNGTNPNLDDQITLAFIKGKDTLNKTNPVADKAKLGIAREEIVLSLVRGYFIGVLREVDGIISNREREVETAWEKQEEGEFFYRIVESFISQDNPTGSALIKTQLTGNVTNVVADAIVSEISRGLVGRLQRHLQQNEETIDVDQNQAMLAAASASLYANIFLDDLELRLGSLQRVRLENALRSLKDASETSGAIKAEASRHTITTIILDYQGQLL